MATAHLQALLWADEGVGMEQRRGRDKALMGALLVMLTGCAPDSGPDPAVERATDADVGGTVEVDNGGPLPLAVTVTEVAGGTPVSNEALPDGEFAVVFASYSNPGSITYVARMRESVTAVGSDGARYLPVRDHTVECDWRLPPLGDEPVPHVTVAPGETADGCAVFDVPAGVAVLFVDVEHDSGETRRWAVR